jgi:hypothetical protein
VPHIHALFIHGENHRVDVLPALKKHKSDIRIIIAEGIGYSLSSVVLIPHEIGDDLMLVADNILPLTFIVDSGSRTPSNLTELAENIKQRILEECDDSFSRIDFSVWIRPQIPNGYAAHLPSEK